MRWKNYVSEFSGPWSLFNKKKKSPFSMDVYQPPIQTGDASLAESLYRQTPLTSEAILYGPDQGGAGVGLSGTGRWGSDIKGKKGQDFEGMMEALSELQFGQETFKSLGKPGGTGGGGFKLFPNSMVNDMASSGPLNLEQQKEDWWKRYLRSIA